MIRVLAFRASVAAIAGAVWIGIATAGPINYSESIDGDLPKDSLTIPLPVFVLDAGINTVSGTVGDYLGDDVIDWDSFAVRVPSGTEVFSARLELTRHDFLSSHRWDLYSGSASFRGGTLLETLNPDFFAVFPYPLTAVDLVDSTPLSAGLYNLSARGHGGMQARPDWGTYTFTFNVRQTASPEVPEPASLALFGLGSLGVGLMARRRRVSARHRPQ